MMWKIKDVRYVCLVYSDIAILYMLTLEKRDLNLDKWMALIKQQNCS